MNPLRRKNTAHSVDRTAIWFTLTLHPIHEIPEQGFLDGALVGAGSLRPVLGHSS